MQLTKLTKRSGLDLISREQMQGSQVLDILRAKLTKRGIDVRCLEKGQIEKISGNKVKQLITVKIGLDAELAKRIVRNIKDSKLKVQTSIQGDVVRVMGAKRDVLQDAIHLVKKQIDDFPMQFQNFRD